MIAEVPAAITPPIDVIAEGDDLIASSRALRGANAPVLVEGGRSLNRRLVDPLGPIQVVAASIAGDGALGRTTRRAPAAPTVHHVVFHQRAGGPSVEAEIAIAIGRPDTGVVTDTTTGRAGAPALAANEVAVGRQTPVDGVVSTRTEIHRHVSGILPIGVEIPAVGTLLIGSDGLRLKAGGRGANQACDEQTTREDAPKRECREHVVFHCLS